MSKFTSVGCIVVALCVASGGRAEIINVNTRIEAPRTFGPGEFLEVVDGPIPPTIVDIVSPALIPTFIRVRGQSQLNVYGGILGAGVNAFDESTIRIYGGEIAHGEDLEAWNNSRIEIWGGVIVGGDELLAGDNATIFVHGGTIGKRPVVRDLGRIEFFGRRLTLQPDGFTPDYYVLSGTLADNTAVNLSVAVRGNGTIVLHNIPEPTSIRILWWGMMLVATRRYFVRHD